MLSGKSLICGAPSLGVLFGKRSFSSSSRVLKNHHQLLVVGGGCAGQATSHQIRNRSKDIDIAVVEPNEKHYYQPGWTMVGGGIFQKDITVRNQSELMASNVKWIQNKVTKFFPEENAVELGDGSKITYDYLIVSTGLQINWGGIKGLKETLGKDGVTSNYSFDSCDKTWEFIKDFKGGNAIFTQPSTPIKCGGAPQKIMYLAEDYFRRSGIRDKAQVHFMTATPKIFAVEKYANALSQVVKNRGINTQFQHELVEIKPEKKEAVFKNLVSGEMISMNYNLLHVTPPMGPPTFIKESPIANEVGWVDTNKDTLQHNKYKNIFALGDCSSLPTSKTAAAVSSQAAVLVPNLLAAMEGKEPKQVYDGYTSCPIPTANGKLILAEFDYNLQPQETFPFDQSKERYSMFLCKKHVIPFMYWNSLIRGKWLGPKTVPFEFLKHQLGMY